MGSEDRLITLKDLNDFKKEILAEIKKLTPNVEEKNWIKTKDVRKLLGLCSGTLQYMRNNNQITFSKIGRTIYYLEADVYRMLASKSNKGEK